jgi:hypothetical protein
MFVNLAFCKLGKGLVGLFLLSEGRVQQLHRAI